MNYAVTEEEITMKKPLAVLITLSILLALSSCWQFLNYERKASYAPTAEVVRWDERYVYNPDSRALEHTTFDHLPDDITQIDSAFEYARNYCDSSYCKEALAASGYDEEASGSLRCFRRFGDTELFTFISNQNAEGVIVAVKDGKAVPAVRFQNDYNLLPPKKCGGKAWFVSTGTVSGVARSAAQDADSDTLLYLYEIDLETLASASYPLDFSADVSETPAPYVTVKELIPTSDRVLLLLEEQSDYLQFLAAFDPAAKTLQTVRVQTCDCACGYKNGCLTLERGEQGGLTLRQYDTALQLVSERAFRVTEEFDPYDVIARAHGDTLYLLYQQQGRYRLALCDIASGKCTFTKGKGDYYNSGQICIVRKENGKIQHLDEIT